MVFIKHNSLKSDIFSNPIFIHGNSFYVFQDAGFQGQSFLGSTLFRVQAFLGPGFSGSRFFWVQVVQDPGPGSGSRFQKQPFKDHDAYIINFFRMSHTLKRNVTKLVQVRKEKNPKFKISSYLRYFVEKNYEI